MKIALGNDHAGTSIRELVLEELKNAGHEVVDFGHAGEDSVDYPDYAARVAEAVRSRQTDLGILICGSGIGMSIAANKFPGIRCALCTDVYSAEITRRHNDANILALRAREAEVQSLPAIVRAFVSSPFEGGRHQRRLDKITEIERRVALDSQIG